AGAGQAVEVLSGKVGEELLVLGALQLVNMMLVTRFRRRQEPGGRPGAPPAQRRGAASWSPAAAGAGRPGPVAGRPAAPPPPPARGGGWPGGGAGSRPGGGAPRARRVVPPPGAAGPRRGPGGPPRGAGCPRRRADCPRRRTDCPRRRTGCPGRVAGCPDEPRGPTLTCMAEAALTPRAEQTRAAIIEAALRLFRETGYEATTMRAIAGAAGGATAQASSYFGSKEELIQESYARNTAEHAAASRPVLDAEKAFAGRLRGTLRALIDVMSPYHEFAAKYFKHAAEPANALSPFSRESSAA